MYCRTMNNNNEIATINYFMKYLKPKNFHVAFFLKLIPVSFSKKTYFKCPKFVSLIFLWHSLKFQALFCFGTSIKEKWSSKKRQPRRGCDLIVRCHRQDEDNKTKAHYRKKSKREKMVSTEPRKLKKEKKFLFFVSCGQL